MIHSDDRADLQGHFDPSKRASSDPKELQFLSLTGGARKVTPPTEPGSLSRKMSAENPSDFKKKPRPETANIPIRGDELNHDSKQASVPKLAGHIKSPESTEDLQHIPRFPKRGTTEAMTQDSKHHHIRTLNA